MKKSNTAMARQNELQKQIASMCAKAIAEACRDICAVSKQCTLRMSEVAELNAALAGELRSAIENARKIAFSLKDADENLRSAFKIKERLANAREALEATSLAPANEAESQWHTCVRMAAYREIATMLGCDLNKQSFSKTRGLQ